MSDPADDPARLADGRHDLRADCGRCAGLCCVAPAFTASADFAIDKPAGQPCPNQPPPGHAGGDAGSSSGRAHAAAPRSG